MNRNKYKSFVNISPPTPDYDCRDLLAMGYIYRARCNKNNPDCKKFIKDKKKEGCLIKIIKLNEKQNLDNKNMIDIWIKKEMSFRKIV